MRDGTQFSSWKDFALAVMDESDAFRDEIDTLKENYSTLKEDYKDFKTRVYTVIAIIVFVVSAFEIGVRL